MLKSYLKPPHNFILFELDFNIKFPLLSLLLFLNDLKSTIRYNYFRACNKFLRGGWSWHFKTIICNPTIYYLPCTIHGSKNGIIAQWAKCLWVLMYIVCLLSASKTYDISHHTHFINFLMHFLFRRYTGWSSITWKRMWN